MFKDLTEFEQNWKVNLDVMSDIELRSTILLMYDWVKMHQSSVNKVNLQKQELRTMIKSMEKVLDNNVR